MPTGHFHIGDLSFTFEGSLKELAHCQEIIREINEAEYRLMKASGSEDVKIIYDDNLEGKRGTFDKMRLRAYDETTNYTLDFGDTETNPLGIFVASDQNIDVYDRETQENWEITPEGERVGKPAGESEQQSRASSETGGADSEAPSPSERTSPREQPNGSPRATGSPQQNGSASASGEQSGSPTGRKAAGGGTMSKTEALDILVKQVSVYPDHHLAGNVEIGPNEEPLDQKIRDFARFCNRSGKYLERVAAVQEFDNAADLKVGDVEETLRLIADEEKLTAKEQNEFG